MISNSPNYFIEQKQNDLALFVQPQIENLKQIYLKTPQILEKIRQHNKELKIIKASIIKASEESKNKENQPSQKRYRRVKREKFTLAEKFVYEKAKQIGQYLYQGGRSILDAAGFWIENQIESFRQHREKQWQDEQELLMAIWDLKVKKRREERQVEAEIIRIKEYIREEITRWARSDYAQREELRSLGQSVEDMYNISLLSEDLQILVEETQAQDHRYRQISNDVLAWTDLTYEERIRLQRDHQDIRSRYNVSDLPENLQILITNTEYQDRQRQTEMESQWAKLRSYRETLEAILNTNSDFDARDYYLSVKLFPIHYDRDPHYRLTNNQDMKSLSLTGYYERLRLEIHNFESEVTREILAENVEELQMSIGCPEDLNCEDNIIRYRVNGSEQFEIYPLNKLNDYQNGTAYFIRVIPYNADRSTQVRWGSGRRTIDKRYKGFFRIQTAKKAVFSNSSELEWSFINDVSIESYVQSVTPSELAPRDYPENCQEALKAQAIAARSYALSIVTQIRTNQTRSWDLTPTIQFQSYQGSQVENTISNDAVKETEGIVLLYNGQVARTEYFACQENRTRDFPQNPIIKARNVPSYISCRSYGRYGAGHGRGMPQIAASSLSCYGWTSNATNLPTQDAIVPEYFREPWNYEDILLYFYHNVQLYDYVNHLYL